METSGQGPGYGTTLALGELNHELSSHSLNGEIWQVPGCGTGPSLGELSLELSDHYLNGGTWLVTRKMN